MLLIDWIGQTAIPFLVGTKYDHFATFSIDEQDEITRQVRYQSFFLVMKKLTFF